MNHRVVAVASMTAWIVAAILGLAGLFVGLVKVRVIGIHYPKLVENRVLERPVRVLSVTGTHLVLEDGRDIEMVDPEIEDELADAVLESSNLVDVDPDGDGYEVSVSQHLWLCGTPWADPVDC